MRLKMRAIGASATALALLAAAAAAATPTPPPPPQTTIMVPTPAPRPAPIRTPAEAARPAIWLLADEDTKIYLIGTIHMLPPGYDWRSPAVERLTAEADELVVEDYSEPGVEEDMAVMLRETPLPLRERVPESKRAVLAAAVRKSGIPARAYGHMHSWAAAMMLDLAITLRGMGVDDPEAAPGVEDALEAAFRAAGKPILSVEDSGKVLEAMNAVPEAAQARMLVMLADEADEGLRPFEEDLGHWRAGRADKLATISGEDFPPEVYEILLTRRNAAWTQWLAERLERPGTVLFAVGAAHLAGADSVQKMLAARGLKATRFD